MQRVGNEKGTKVVQKVRRLVQLCEGCKGCKLPLLQPSGKGWQRRCKGTKGEKGIKAGAKSEKYQKFLCIPHILTRFTHPLHLLTSIGSLLFLCTLHILLHHPLHLSYSLPIPTRNLVKLSLSGYFLNPLTSSGMLR